MKNKLSFVCFLSIWIVSFTSCLSTKVSPKENKELTCISVEPIVDVKYKMEFYGIKKENKIDVMYVYWFDNWANGWTEVRFVATGEISINSENTFKIETPIVIEYPESAKIRAKDTYLSGEEAIKALNNRLQRIEAIKEQIDLAGIKYGYAQFEQIWGEKFYPEKYRKTETYQNLNKDAEKSFSDGINWNVEYTQKILPEYMWDARNSGTLYKDWEEAYDLIYILCNWDVLFDYDKIIHIQSKKNKK